MEGHLKFSPKNREGAEGYTLDPMQYRDMIDVPCGKCVGCLKEIARQWSIRIYHEAKSHQAADLGCSFITLTYDNDNLPGYGTGPDDHGVPTLRKADIPEFMKRLRKILARDNGQKIRFFICGEYGPSTSRPHYHGIIFGESFGDRMPLGRRGKSGKQLYTSNVIKRAWPYGFNYVGEDVSPASIAYVSKYVTKNVSPADKPDTIDKYREPEFRLMSNRPGLGYNWIITHLEEVYPDDFVVIEGHRHKPPRYYDEILRKVNPVLHGEVKFKRVQAAEESAKALWCEIGQNPFRWEQKEQYQKETITQRGEGQ